LARAVVRPRELLLLVSQGGTAAGLALEQLALLFVEKALELLFLLVH
jgi:hypothetical protein